MRISILFALLMLFGGFVDGVDFARKSPQAEVQAQLGDAYFVLGIIGNGGQGIICSAEDVHGQLFAVKMFQDLTTVGNRTAAENEYDMIQRLQHIPQIRQVHSLVGRNILILEYLEGLDLEHTLSHRYVDRHLVFAWIDDLISCLISTVEAQVLPFGVSLDNLFIEKGDALRVIDLAEFIDLCDQDYNGVFSLSWAAYYTANELCGIVNALLSATDTPRLPHSLRPSRQLLETANGDDLQQKFLLYLYQLQAAVRSR